MLLKKRIIVSVIGLGIVGMCVFMWLSLEKTQAVKKVYKTTPSPEHPRSVSPEHPRSANTTVGTEKLKAENTPPPFDHVSYLAKLKAFVEKDPIEGTVNFIKYLESPEGQAFLSSNPTRQEFEAVHERYYRQAPITREWFLKRRYRRELQGRPLDEIEQEIKDYISERILAEGYHLRKATVIEVIDLMEETYDNTPIGTFLSKKYADNRSLSSKWFLNTLKSLIRAEYENVQSHLHVGESPTADAPPEPVATKRDEPTDAGTPLEPARVPDSEKPTVSSRLPGPQPTASGVSMFLSKQQQQEILITSSRERWGGERLGKTMAILREYGNKEGLRPPPRIRPRSRRPR